MRLGLVGAGRWGTRYVATLRDMQGVMLAHLASSNPASAALVPPGCRLSADWRAVAADPTLDGIVVATPPASHLEIALAAVEHGIAVLVEKPLTLSVADAKLLAARAQRAGVLVMVGHTHLYSAAFRELKSRGAALGTLIETRSVGGNRGPYRPDTPVLWDWGPHDVAMCLELFGEAPNTVQARRAATERLPEGVGEAIELVLEFGAGRRSEIRISNIEAHKQRCFEACYEGGTLVYDDLAADKLVLKAAGSLVTQALPLDSTPPLTNLVRAFCRGIVAGERAGASLELGLKVVEVLAACQAILEPANAGSAAVSR